MTLAIKRTHGTHKGEHGMTSIVDNPHLIDRIEEAVEVSLSTLGGRQSEHSSAPEWISARLTEDERKWVVDALRDRDRLKHMLHTIATHPDVPELIKQYAAGRLG